MGLRVVGKPISDIQELFLSDGTTVKLNIYDNQKLNSQQISSYIQDNSKYFENIAGSEAIVGFDGTNNQISVHAFKPISNSNKVAPSSMKVTMPSEIGIPIKITYHTEPNRDMAIVTKKVVGGMLIGDPKACTAGFTGYMNNVAGFMTATHCAKNNMGYGHDGFNFILDPKKAYTNYSTKHEMSFIPTPNAGLYPGVYKNISTVDDSLILKIKGIRSQPLKLHSTYLCHMGITTGYSCGTVEAIDIQNNSVNGEGAASGCSSKSSPNFSISSQPCSKTFVSLKGTQLACNFGDSGGPVFSEDGMAHGIASSAYFTGKDKGQCDVLTYSKIEYASEMNFNLAK